VISPASDYRVPAYSPSSWCTIFGAKLFIANTVCESSCASASVTSMLIGC
jgi:hypothetical protein